MSGIISGIKKVMPVDPSAKQMGTQTPPKQHTQADLEKKKKKDPDAIVDIKAEGQLYSTGGGAGQSYRKYTPKPAGMSEEQAPMFTPEAKMVNANDPMSDGWRWYKTKLDEEAIDVVKQAIVNQVKKNKINLVHKYGIKPLITAINQVAQKHAATPEKSLSDISIWVKELENMLERGKGGTFEEQQLDEKCWDTHKQVGMKKKGGRMVPNCVPKESLEEISDFKKKELEYELRNEPANNYAVHIDGRKWKVFKDKSHAEAVARKLRAKGKDVKIYITGEAPNVSEGEDLNENLRKWFKEKWVRFGPDGKIRGDCARGDDSEGKPKCLPQSKAHALGKKGRASAAARKRREDPNPERRGKAKNVATKKKTNESNDPGYTKALADLQYLVDFIKSNPKMMGKEIKQMGPINPAQNIIKKALKGCDYIEQLLKAQNNVAVSSAMNNLKKELMNWFNDGNKPLSDLLQGTAGKLKFPSKESAVLKGMLEALVDPEADRMVKNIIAQNPKGSAADYSILRTFLFSKSNPGDVDDSEWIDTASEWLKANKKFLQDRYPEADLRDLQSYAENMYVDYKMSKPRK